MNAAGQRRRRARASARVRASPPSFDEGAGGAKCSTRPARPAQAASRRKLAGASRSPASGVMPICRKAAALAALRHRASTRTRGNSRRAARTPTSPQPTMSTRARRKRAGSARGRAPQKKRFTGKIRSRNRLAVFAGGFFIQSLLSQSGRERQKRGNRDGLQGANRPNPRFSCFLRPQADCRQAPQNSPRRYPNELFRYRATRRLQL